MATCLPILSEGGSIGRGGLEFAISGGPLMMSTKMPAALDLRFQQATNVTRFLLENYYIEH